MGCNWSALLAKDRCKALGVPWSGDELKAIYKLNIPADYVRQGCLTVKDYENMLNGVTEEEKKVGKKQLVHMRKDELVEEAKGLGIEVSDPEATTRNDLIQLIKTKQESELPNES